MTYARPDALVSTEWLAARLDAPDVRVVDGSFYLPAAKRDPKAEYANQHIPGAVFFDIDEIADTEVRGSRDQGRLIGSENDVPAEP